MKKDQSYLLSPDTPFCSSEDKANIYSEIYSKVEDKLNQSILPRAYNESVQAMISSGKNHFRSVVIALVGDLTKENPDFTLQVAALAEYSWAAILIFDDIGDQEKLRRGQPPLWRQRGLLYATQSAVAISFDVLEQLCSIQESNMNFPLAVSYSRMMRTTAIGQLQADSLRFTSSRLEYYRSMLAKTEPLRWAIRLVSQKNKGFARRFLSACRHLGVAATIKNDLEDLYPPDLLYESQGVDLLQGQITYPLRILYDECSEIDKKDLARSFDKKDNNSYRLSIVYELLNKYPNCTNICRLELKMSVEKALQELNESKLYIETELADRTHFRVLADWMDSYQDIVIP